MGSGLESTPRIAASTPPLSSRYCVSINLPLSMTLLHVILVILMATHATGLSPFYLFDFSILLHD